MRDHQNKKQLDCYQIFYMPKRTDSKEWIDYKYEEWCQNNVSLSFLMLLFLQNLTIVLDATNFHNWYYIDQYLGIIFLILIYYLREWKIHDFYLLLKLILNLVCFDHHHNWLYLLVWQSNQKNFESFMDF